MIITSDANLHASYIKVIFVLQLLYDSHASQLVNSLQKTNLLHASIPTAVSEMPTVMKHISWATQ